MNIESILRTSVYWLLRLMFGVRTTSIPLPTNGIRKILILRYDRIGDMILTTPVFELIRQHLPNTELHVLASPANAALIAHDSRITRVWHWQWQSSSKIRMIYSLWTLGQQMRHEQFDYAFCLVFNKTWDAFLVHQLCGKNTRRITIAHEHRIRFYEPLYDVQVPRITGNLALLLAHVVSYPFGWTWNTSDIVPFIALAYHHRLRAKAFVQQAANGRQILFINLSAGSTNRSWTAEAATESVHLLQQRYPEYCIIVGTAPHDQRILEHLCAMCATVVPAPVSADILDVCALVEQCAVIITPDTSLVHCASAFGKPLVALYAQDSYQELFIPHNIPCEIVRSGSTVSNIPTDEIITAFERIYRRIVAEL
jgi:ADP-heptose:LPS heptosyltransferase